MSSVKAHFYYLTHFYFFYLPAACLPALAYTYIHCSSSHKQCACNTYKHSENESLTVASVHSGSQALGSIQTAQKEPRAEPRQVHATRAPQTMRLAILQVKP